MERCLAVAASCLPISSLLKKPVALWHPVLLDDIIVLILPYPFEQALCLGVDILADLLVSSGHRLEEGCTPVAHSHVHMC